jgi:hypothetical protein
MEGGDQLHVPVALSLWKYSPLLFAYEVGWTPEPIWIVWSKEKSFDNVWEMNPGLSVCKPSL